MDGDGYISLDNDCRTISVAVAFQDFNKVSDEGDVSDEFPNVGPFSLLENLSWLGHLVLEL